MSDVRGTPRTWFSGRSSPDSRRGPNPSTLTLLVLFLLSPIGAATALAGYLVFALGRRSWKVIAGTTGIYGGLWLLAGGASRDSLTRYTLGWREATTALLERNLGEVAADRWLIWLWAQLPLSLLIGGAAASIYSWWRWIRRPMWVEHEQKPGPLDVWRRRRTIKAIASDTKGPNDGVTIGHNRWGHRVVQHDRAAAAHTLVVGGSGAGKALDINTPIPTPDGFRRMGDLQVGDVVFTEHGKPTRVVGAFDFQHERPCYEVQFSDYSTLVADGEHLWYVEASNGWSGVITTEELWSRLAEEPATRYRVPVVSGPVWYPTQQQPVPAYLVGVWLAAGVPNIRGRAVLNLPSSHLVEVWVQAGYRLTPTSGGFHQLPDEAAATLAELGLLSGSWIPEVYRFGDPRQRQDLLAGVVDVAGEITPDGAVAVTLPLLPVIEQLGVVAASLGHQTRPIRQCAGGWQILIQPAGQIFRDPRKQHQLHETRAGRANTPGVREILRITPVVSRPVRCIKVANPSGLFLAGTSFIPTHNTTTMLMGMRDVIRLGRGLVVIDLKGGPDVPGQLAEWAARYGRRFLHWSISDPRGGYTGPADGPAYYDPVGRGDPSRRKDLLIGSQKWDVEYYKTVIANYVQLAFRVADRVPNPGVASLIDLAVLLDPRRLAERAATLFHNTTLTQEARRMVVAYGRRLRWWEMLDHVLDPHDAELLQAVATTISQMDESERSGIRNMAARLQTLNQSTAGAWLKKDPTGQRDIDLRRSADEGWVVVFSLDSSNYEQTSALLAGLIIQDLKTLSSELRQHPAPQPLHVYIDEFAAVGNDNVLGLLNKARDAKMPITLATQALADLRRADPAFVDQVLGIVGNFLIHRANTDTDAEVFAGLTGRHKVFRKQYGIEMASGGVPGTIGIGAATGQGYVFEDEEYRVQPAVFQDLQPGQVVYIAKAPTMRIEHVTVVREDPAAVAMTHTPNRAGNTAPSAAFSAASTVVPALAEPGVPSQVTNPVAQPEGSVPSAPAGAPAAAVPPPHLGMVGAAEPVDGVGEPSAGSPTPPEGEGQEWEQVSPVPRMAVPQIDLTTPITPQRTPTAASASTASTAPHPPAQAVPPHEPRPPAGGGGRPVVARRVIAAPPPLPPLPPRSSPLETAAAQGGMPITTPTPPPQPQQQPQQPPAVTPDESTW